MFTGIIETVGEVKEIITSGGNKSFWIHSPLSSALKVDQSVAHNGVCLTVEDVQADTHKVTAIAETLKKTAIGTWNRGTAINLERSMTASSRIDGHFVQGHVDARGRCKDVRNRDGSFEYQFAFPKKFASLVIEKGSIALNGISLTVFDVKKDRFKVAIIPYTYEHTNMKQLQPGNEVNIEFDMIGKYILRKLSLEK